MKIILNISRHCIETAAKAKYEQLIRSYLKRGTPEKEKRFIENQIDALKFFLEHTDFNELRYRCSLEGPNQEAELTVGRALENMVVRIKGKAVYRKLGENKGENMELNFKDKVIMTAAASKGMGYAIARQCAEEGAKVSMASRSKEQIEAAADQIQKETNSDVTPFVFDASNGASIEQWTEKTLDVYGRIDGLLVNAGGPPTGQFDDFSDKDWQNAFELTLLSSIRMIRSVLPAMRNQGGGSILTITSSSIKEPIDVLILSNVMRSGVTSLVKSLSQQLAKDRIRVNNIIPGYIATDRLTALDIQGAEKMGISVEQRRSQTESTIPWGRYGKPDEFARAAAFLLSDAASYITGVSLAVDGGRMKTVW